MRVLVALSLLFGCAAAAGDEPIKVPMRPEAIAKGTTPVSGSVMAEPGPFDFCGTVPHADAGAR